MKTFVFQHFKPGQCALTTFLESFPHIEIIGIAEARSARLEAYKKATPGLVILSLDPPGSADLELIRQVKTLWPHAACLVITDNLRRREQVMAAGADRVLLRGFSAAEFARALPANGKNGAFHAK